MSGVPDPLYIQARRVLLDALEALGSQRQAVVLVGAQAIYLHTGESDLAVAPFTTDGDIALDPRALNADPKLEEAMKQAGFVRDHSQPGVWTGAQSVMIDLLVPEALSGRGRRGARLGEHGKIAARKARGLETAIVDNVQMTIAALEDRDVRRFEVAVASPAALLVAKLHKVAERRGQPDRLGDKDALDILRLLRGGSTGQLVAELERLTSDELSAAVTEEALRYLEELFSTADGLGSQMAARATERLDDPATIAASCAALAVDLLKAMRGT